MKPQRKYLPQNTLRMNSAFARMFDKFSEKFFSRVTAEEFPSEKEAQLAVLKDTWMQVADSIKVSVSFKKVASPGEDFGEEDSVDSCENKPIVKSPEVEAEVKVTKGKRTKHEGPVTACVFKPSRGKGNGIVCGLPTIKGKKVCSKHKAKEADLVDESDLDAVNTANVEKIVKTSEEKKTCTFKIMKGERNGKDCGAAAKIGCDLCSRHLKLSASAKSDAKVVESPEKSEPEVKVSKTKKPKATEPVVPKVNNAVVKDKNLGVFVHKPTGFVFRDPATNNKSTVVYGKIHDGSIVHLTEEDKAAIESYGWDCEKIVEPTRIKSKESKVEPKASTPKVKASKSHPEIKKLINARNVEETIRDMIKSDDEDENENMPEPGDSPSFDGGMSEQLEEEDD